MPKPLRVEGPSTAEEVAQARKKAKKPWEVERLLAIQMAQQGEFRIKDIAKALARGHATLERWFRDFRQEGLQALLAARTKTRNPSLNEEDVKALEEVLRKGKFKRAKEIRKWLQEERNVHISLKAVYYWLGKVKARHKVPRSVHEKQNPQARQAFPQEIAGKLDALDIPQHKRVRIWVEDEH